MLLPLATSIVIRFLADRHRQLPWFAGLLAVQALILVTVFAGLNYFTLVWVAPALTLLYWMSTRAVGRLQPGTA